VRACARESWSRAPYGADVALCKGRICSLGLEAELDRKFAAAMTFHSGFVRGSLIGAKCLTRYLRSLVPDESRHCIAQTSVATVGHVEVVAVEHVVERHFT
jgi:hypothetical protein